MIDKLKIEHGLELFLCIFCDVALDSKTWAGTIYKPIDFFNEFNEKIFFCKDCFDCEDLKKLKFNNSGFLNHCLICEYSVFEPAFYLCFSSLGNVLEDRWLAFHEDCYEDFVGEEFMF